MEEDFNSEPAQKKFKVSHSYNRCRKPCKSKDKTCSTKNLKRASVNLINKYNNKFHINPPLSRNDKFCYSCLTYLNKECESSQEISAGKIFNF